MHEGHRERLRKTFLSAGEDALHDHQLLELLLTYAIPRRDTNPLAHMLLKSYGSLEKVLTADPQELMLLPGIGEQAAVLLSLAGVLSGRCTKAMPQKRPCLGQPAAAIGYCRGLFFGAKYEEIYAISLDAKNMLLHTDKIASGTLSETTLYPRLVLEHALRHGAAAVILAHNHPSGDPTPSPEDVSATRKVYEALGSIGIKLLDHLIVGKNAVYSMARSAPIGFAETENVPG